MAVIELWIRIGREREGGETLCFPLEVDDRLLYELSEPMEVSSDASAVVLDGWQPGISSFDAVVNTFTKRQRKFEMQERHAEDIAREIKAKMLKFFARRNTHNGYTQDQTEQLFGPHETARRFRHPRG